MHINVSISFPEVSRVSIVIEMQKLQLLLKVLPLKKRKEYAKKKGSHTDELPHMHGDF